jgi:hypothetical protein
MMKRISRGRLVNKVKRWGAPSGTIAAASDITCFEFVPERKLDETGFVFDCEEIKEIYARDLPAYI